MQNVEFFNCVVQTFSGSYPSYCTIYRDRDLESCKIVLSTWVVENKATLTRCEIVSKSARYVWVDGRWRNIAI